MGLFDAFRKKPADTAPAAASGGLLGALVQRHGLKPAKPPPESALSGTWWAQPPGNGLSLAFLARGADVVAFLGEPVEITEIYLARAPAGEFRLGAGSESDFPQLRLPAVRAGLARLSAAVKEFQLFENHAGVALQFAAGASAEEVAQDLATARELLVAFGKK